jgi:hypothetical protein
MRVNETSFTRLVQEEEEELVLLLIVGDSIIEEPVGNIQLKIIRSLT